MYTCTFTENNSFTVYQIAYFVKLCGFKLLLPDSTLQKVPN